MGPRLLLPALPSFKKKKDIKQYFQILGTQTLKFKLTHSGRLTNTRTVSAGASEQGTCPYFSDYKTLLSFRGEK